MRRNNSGFANMAYGYLTNPYIPDAEHIKAVHNCLKGTTVSVASYKDILRHVQAGDFIYFDPPYDEDELRYNPDSFDFRDQHELFSLCVKIHKRGAYFLLSNASTQRIKNLYKAFHMDYISAPRTFSCNSKSRKSCREIMIRNY